MMMGYHCDSVQATPRNLKVLVQNPWHLWLGITQAQEAPSLAIPQALEVTILANMTPLHVNLGATKRVYSCWVEGCNEVPSTACVAICAHVHRAHLGVKLSCPSSLWTFLNSDTLGQHKKQVHTSGSPNPH